jgi:hypothetical protein
VWDKFTVYSALHHGLYNQFTSVDVLSETTEKEKSEKRAGGK